MFNIIHPVLAHGSVQLPDSNLQRSLPGTVPLLGGTMPGYFHRREDASMPIIEVELVHLDQADRHMAIARDSLAAAETLSLQARPAEEAEDRLEMFREALAAFEGHRANILKTIEELRNGSLPRSHRGLAANHRRAPLAVRCQGGVSGPLRSVEGRLQAVRISGA